MDYMTLKEASREMGCVRRGRVNYYVYMLGASPVL